MPRLETKSSRLVGRVAELGRLRSALDKAATGRGFAVLVAGEAGIGKTRLVAELAEVARDAGALVLSGRCIDLIGPGVPYFALLEALRSAPEAETQGLLRDLVRLADPEGRSSPDGQLRLFERVQSTLDEKAAATPVVLVLEDLHWADGSTLDFLAFLCRAIRDRRILVVATYRSDEVRLGDPLARTVVELVRSGEALALELLPLRTGDLTAMLEDAAGRALPDELTEAIVARSGGNPFFAQELLAAADRGEHALPRLLRDALLQRVGRIEATGQAVLRVAAAFGRDVPHRLLAALADVEDARLDAALRQAVEHGVLVADQAAATYRFRHALLAEAVHGTILPGEAERLHERLAVALTDYPGIGGELAGAGDLARHWIAAGRPLQALACSMRAARDAESVYGLSEALRHLERALELWPEVPGAPEVAGADLPAVLAGAAELADLTGRGPRAAELVRRAIDLVNADTDPVRAGLLHERLGSYLLPGGEWLAALAACQRAADLVPWRPPSAERARVLTTLGNALMLSWRHGESEPVCEQALAMAEAIGDPRSALRAQGILGIDLCYLGRPEEGIRLARAARDRALPSGTARDIAHSHALICEVLMANGRPDEAAQVALDGLERAQRLGVERSFGALLAAYAAEGFLETGDWDRADALLTQAHRAGTPFWGHYPRLLHAQLATARGKYAAARHHLAAGALGERQPTSAPRHARVVAELALWQGRPDLAATAVDEGLVASNAGRSPVHAIRLGTLGVCAQAERAQLAAPRDRSTVEDARRHASQLLTLVRGNAPHAATVTPEAAAWQARAEAEYSRLDVRPDPECWRAAVAAWDELARPYPAAYSRWRLAEALLAHGSPARRGEAVHAARDAYRVANALAAVPLRHALDLLARRARLDLEGLPAPAQRDPVDALGLTAREGEVLLLLTRGYTNREIATELTISVKTASVHVSHILRKLGVARRVDAAAIGQRLPVTQPGANPG